MIAWFAVNPSWVISICKMLICRIVFIYSMEKCFLQSQHLIRPFNSMAINQVWLEGFGCSSATTVHHKLDKGLYFLIVLYKILIVWPQIWQLVKLSGMISRCDLHSPDIQLSFSHHSLGRSCCVLGLFCNSSLSSVSGHGETRPGSLKRSIGPFSDKRTTGICVCARLCM